MAIAREVIGSRSGDGDRRGRRTLQRQYVITGADATTVTRTPHSVTDAGGQTLPPFGDTFDGLILERYTVSGTAPRIIATAEYVSPNVAILTPRVLPAQEGERRFTGAFQEVEYDIPYAYRQSVQVVSQAAGVTANVRGWVISDIKVFGTVRRFILRTVYRPTSVADKFAAVEVMDQQHGRLHVIQFGSRARVYRFESGDYRDTDQGLELEYTWAYDPGHRSIAQTTPPDRDTRYPAYLLHPISALDTYSDWLQWVRPPYCITVAIPGPTANDPPTFEAVCPYVYEPYGWQSLRGLT